MNFTYTMYTIFTALLEYIHILCVKKITPFTENNGLPQDQLQPTKLNTSRAYKIVEFNINFVYL